MVNGPILVITKLRQVKFLLPFGLLSKFDYISYLICQIYGKYFVQLLAIFVAINLWQPSMSSITYVERIEETKFQT